MRKTLLMLLMFAALTTTKAQTNDWQPIKVWPFVYEEFTDAKIYTSASGKMLTAKANIHVDAATLWYVSGKKHLQAKQGTVDHVVFKDGAEYYVYDNKLCQILSQDTIDGNPARLIMAPLINRAEFEEQARQNNQNSVLTSDFGSILQDMATSVNDDQNTRDFDHTPLPMRPRFYADLNGEVFELTESNIMKHLGSKEERRAYGAYARRAEVMYGSRRSMLDVWHTFFVNQGNTN